jgi:hypothetical protein
LSFPLAHFPDAHFPDAHFPHEAAEGGGMAVLTQYEYFMEDEDDMQTLAKPKSVTKSDTDLNCAVLADGRNPEFLYVGTSGAVALVLADKSELTLPGVAAGGFLWMPSFTGILSTGTTATGLMVTRRV